MRVLQAFETSSKLIDEGRTCEIEFEGKVIATVQVRPADAMLNPDYRRHIAEMSIDAARLNGADPMDVVQDQDFLFQLYARAVVTGWTWTDAEDQKATSLRFNEKNAVALFKRAPKFFEAIQLAARQWSHYRAAHEEKAAGN